MSKAYTTKQTTVLLSDAISSFYSDLEALRDEAQEIVDSAIADSPRVQAFGETADTLSEIDSDQVDSDELPKELRTVELTVTVAVPRRKGYQPSRSVRCANACAYATVVVDHLNKWSAEETERLEEADQEAVENSEDYSVEALAFTAKQREDRRFAVATARAIAEVLQEQAEEAADVEFPGMFG